MAAIGSSFASRLTRDCAWRAFEALAREAVDEGLQVLALGLLLHLAAWLVSSRFSASCLANEV